MKFLKKISKKNIYIFLKTLCDIFFSLTVIIIGSPLFLIIAILIKFSSRGPIFYYHQRLGKNSKLFYCIKFRTMHPEADDILENLIEKNEKVKIEFEKTHKLRNDPRITRIGKFLRKTSLDELPQFLNVIKLDMSVIGPRPIVEKEIEKYGIKIKKVLSIRPGITGLWQVSGRNNLSYKKRIYLDSLYVESFNLLMDLRIIIRTFGVLLFPMDRGAY